jgi:integrase
MSPKLSPKLSSTSSPRKRARNGEGTIGQLSDGRWQAKLSLGNGQRRTFTGATEEIVAGKLLEARAQQQAGLPVAPAGVTVASYLERWLAQRQAALKPTTWTNYELNVRLHIAPYVGKKRLAALDPDDVRDWHAALKADGLGPRSIVLAHATLRTALAQAESDNLLARNVAAKVHPPKAVRPKVEPYDVEEIATLQRAMKDHPLEPLLLLTLGVGLRRGEVCGLRWRDVDLEAGTLTIRGQLVRNRGGGFRYQPSAKTEGSEDTVALPSYVVRVLRDHRDRAVLAKAGGSKLSRGYVFTRPDAEPHSPEMVYLDYQRLIREAGLRHQRFHDLRHAAASLMLGEGVPLWQVSKMLRHASVRITADIYGHLYAEGAREAAGKMSALLERGE